MDGIAEALNTTFVEMSGAPDFSVGDDMPVAVQPLTVDCELVRSERIEADADVRDSVYIREKLKTLAEKSDKFFDEVRDEFKQAPTSKMAESAGAVLNTAVNALSKLADIDEGRKKRTYGREKDARKVAPVGTPSIEAGGDVHLTQNVIHASREDILKMIRRDNIETREKIENENV